MKKTIIFAILVLLLAACGTTSQSDDDSQVSNQATAIEAIEVSEQPTQSGGADVENVVAANLDDDLGLPFSFMPDVYGFIDVFESPLDDWSCDETSTSGDTSDADDDGIAVNAAYTIECTKGFDGLPFIADVVTVTKTTTLTMKDADDSDPTSGYVSTGDVVYSYLDDAFTAEHKFDRSWTKGSDSYNYDNADEWIWSSGDGSMSTKQSRSGTYTPDDMDDPFAAGWIEGQATVENYANDVLAHRVLEEVKLHLNEECSPAADDGEITFTWSLVDENGNEVAYAETAEFTGCGEYHKKVTDE